VVLPPQVYLDPSTPFGGAPQAAGQAPPGSGLNAAAVMSKMAAPIMALTAAVSSFTAAAQGAAQATNIAASSAMTGAQKSRAMAEAIPIVGRVAQAVHDLADAFERTEDRIRQSRYRFEEAAIRQAGFIEREQARLSAQSRIGPQETLAEAMRGARVIKAPDQYGQTHLEEIRLREQAQRYPLLTASARAQHAANAANRDVEAARRQYNRLIARRSILRAEAQDARRASELAVEQENESNDPRSLQFWVTNGRRQKATREERGREALEANRALQGNEQLIQQASLQLQERQTVAAEKESLARKTSLAVLRDQVEVLRARGQMILAETESAGRMNPLQRQIGLQALRAVKAGGRDSVTPEMLGLAEQLAPAYMRDLYARHGAKAPETEALKAEGFWRPESIEAIRTELGKVQTQVQVAINLDEAALAERIAEALRDGMTRLIASMRIQMGRELDDLRENRRRQQNMEAR
jgi:hypothetical protein